MREGCVARGLDLSAFICKDQLDGVVGFGSGGDLRGDPAELLVGEPYSGPLAVYVFGHGVEGGRGGEVVTSRQRLKPSSSPTPAPSSRCPALSQISAP